MSIRTTESRLKTKYSSIRSCHMARSAPYRRSSASYWIAICQARNKSLWWEIFPKLVSLGSTRTLCLNTFMTGHERSSFTAFSESNTPKSTPSVGVSCIGIAICVVYSAMVSKLTVMLLVLVVRMCSIKSHNRLQEWVTKTNFYRYSEFCA